MGCKWKQFLKCFLLNVQLLTVKVRSDISERTCNHSIPVAVVNKLSPSSAADKEFQKISKP
ncbi:hypothetical protein M514_20471 [Trichuris suis]|uniref:Uncharacterized protein n=1 Tax=Trichuris suis TaxID=68888 RepID=A0A085ND89_9BILA|nr:hypothetical protein M514_20471 [Trichuris suis]